MSHGRHTVLGHALIESLGAALLILGLVASQAVSRDAPPSCSSPGVLTGSPDPAAPHRAGPHVTVASLNLAGKGGGVDVFRDILKTNIKLGLDLVLLQEVEQRPGERSVIAAELADLLRFHYIFAPADHRKDGGVHGLAILSRYPLLDVEVLSLKRYDLRFRRRCRIALAATALTPLGPLRAFNVHLDSRINTQERLQQLAPVVDSAGLFQGSSLLGGDFNTANIRWLRRWIPLPYCSQQSAAVREMMAQRGFDTPETGPTFRYLGLKLDWVFVRGPRPVDSGIEEIWFSDHRLIWVRLAGADRFDPPQ